MSLVKKSLFTSLKRPSAGNNKTYFKYALRHNWQHFAFYLILMLLLVVVPTVMSVQSGLTTQYSVSYYSFESRQNEGSSLLLIASVLTFIASCGVSVFAFMSAAGYVNSKQAVGCFHSFPFTRSFLFFTESGVKGLYFLGSLAFTSLLSYTIICFNFPVRAEANTFYFQMLLMSLLAYCLFFSIGMFAAGLAGTGLLRFLLFGVIVGLPIAVYLLVCAAVNLGMPDVDIDPYFEFDFVKWLCPVTFLVDIILRLGGDNGAEVNFPLSILLTLLPIAAFYGGALLLHLKRKSEASGTSIIWKPVFSIIKYAVIFFCTLGGGLFFRVVFLSSSGWYFFGCLFGMLLSFMLTNVILYRSVRSMFKGVRGLCVMAVFMVMFSLFTVDDIANLNAHMWSAGNTRSITLTFDNVTIEYTDDEDIDSLVPLLQDYMDHKYDYEYQLVNDYIDTLIPVDQQTTEDIAKYMIYYESEKYYGDRYGYDGDYKEQVYYETTAVGYDATGLEDIVAGVVKPETVHVTEKDIANRVYQIDYQNHYNMRLSWRQIPHVGLLSSKRVNIQYTAKSKALIEYIIASDEYAAAINKVKEVAPEDVHDMSVQILAYYSEYYSNRRLDSIREDFARLIEVYDFSNEKRLNSPAVGWISIYSDNGRFMLPVYAEDYQVLNLLGELYGLDYRFKSVEAVYDFMAENNDAMFLIEKETGRTVSVTDHDAKKELIRSLPHTGFSGRGYFETDGNRYIAVAVYNGTKSYEGIQTYAVPVRPSKEAEMSQYFPEK